jgi:hypothetical protein
MTKTMSAFGNRAWPVSERKNDESNDMKVMVKLRMFIGAALCELSSKSPCLAGFSG